ncbi:MAG: NAD(+)/NADH kinase [Candidatus Wallbacteria bacterium]|nr:NAD(+)/NADH kinase [Candidatus Wallbacteria bacterium]
MPRQKPPRHIGIVFYLKNRLALELAESIAALLVSRGAQILVEEECGLTMTGGYRLATMHDLVRQVDVLIAVGGDGTLLHAARHAAMAGTPLLGVNRGTVGFLTELSPHHAIQGLERMLAGEFRIELRMMLDVRVMHKDRQLARHIGLNDAVVKREISRILRYDLSLNGEYLDSFPADGVIVATPTGSTAYSLSAGGPIIKPDLDVLLICPICPHRFYGRSLIVSAGDTLEISFARHTDVSEEAMDTSGIYLTVDGQTSRTLDACDRVRIQRSRHHTHLVRLEEADFFQVLRSKLG